MTCNNINLHVKHMNKKEHLSGIRTLGGALGIARSKELKLIYLK